MRLETRAVLETAGLPVLVVAALLVGLESLKTRDALPITLPAPSQIASAWTAQHEALLFHLGPTLRTAVTGYLLAALSGLGLAVLATLVPRSERSVLGLGVAVDSLPLIALSPILMLWLGNGPAAHVPITWIACQFPLLVGLVRGMKAVPRSGEELFHVLAASPWQRWRKLVLPTALPYAFAALKVAAPLAVLGALIAEWVSAERGLGIMMVYALFSFDAAQVWLVILTVCLLSVTAYGLVALAERLVAPWARTVAIAR
jgi:ABC-type nitrate/sulfonate/bicarbonate transport system permease component